MAEEKRDGCRHLEVYKLAHDLGERLHAMSLKLPSFEQFEEARQIRKSSKSVSAQLVEGYRLRKYRDEFLHYLHRAAASADETREHLDYLHKTGSLKDASEYALLAADGEKLLAKLINFTTGVEHNHSKPFYLR